MRALAASKELLLVGNDAPQFPRTLRIKKAAVEPLFICPGISESLLKICAQSKLHPSNCLALDLRRTTHK